MLWAAAILVLILALSSSLLRGRVQPKELSLVASLAALAAVGRVPFATLPGVQPTTFIVLASGWIFGPRAGFSVGSLAALISNFFLGQGPWTPWQMLAWGLVGLTAGLAGRVSKTPDRYTLAAFGGFWGYLFGLIMNTWHWLTFIYPLTWQSFLATWTLSFWFDTAHAVTNVVLGLALGPGILAILRRYQERIETSLHEPGEDS